MENRTTLDSTVTNEELRLWGSIPNHTEAVLSPIDKDASSTTSAEDDNAATDYEDAGHEVLPPDTELSPVNLSDLSISMIPQDDPIIPCSAPPTTTTNHHEQEQHKPESSESDETYVSSKSKSNSFSPTQMGTTQINELSQRTKRYVQKQDKKRKEAQDELVALPDQHDLSHTFHDPSELTDTQMLEAIDFDKCDHCERELDDIEKNLTFMQKHYTECHKEHLIQCKYAPSCNILIPPYKKSSEEHHAIYHPKCVTCNQNTSYSRTSMAKHDSCEDCSKSTNNTNKPREIDKFSRNYDKSDFYKKSKAASGIEHAPGKTAVNKKI